MFQINNDMYYTIRETDKYLQNHFDGLICLTELIIVARENGLKVRKRKIGGCPHYNKLDIDNFITNMEIEKIGEYILECVPRGTYND